LSSCGQCSPRDFSLEIGSIPQKAGVCPDCELLLFGHANRGLDVFSLLDKSFFCAVSLRGYRPAMAHMPGWFDPPFNFSGLGNLGGTPQRIPVFSFLFVFFANLFFPGGCAFAGPLCITIELPLAKLFGAWFLPPPRNNAIIRASCPSGAMAGTPPVGLLSPFGPYQFGHPAMSIGFF